MVIDYRPIFKISIFKRVLYEKKNRFTRVFIADNLLSDQEENELKEKLGDRVHEEKHFRLYGKSKEYLQDIINEAGYTLNGQLPVGKYFLSNYPESAFDGLIKLFKDIQQKQ